MDVLDDLKRAASGLLVGGDYWGDCELINRAIVEIERLRMAQTPGPSFRDIKQEIKHGPSV